MQTLTSFETLAIKGWRMNVGVNTPNFAQAQKNDNATYHGVEDIATSCGLDTKKARGVASSLIQKGLIERDDGVFILTDEGIDVYAQLIKTGK